jgi:hypothetical protein
MPDTGLYLDGFSISEGDTFGNYKIKNIDIEHHQVVRWNEYSYPVTIEFMWKGKGKPSHSKFVAAMDEFSEHVEKVRIIRSESGRPYRCNFGKIEADSSEDFKSATLTASGFCKRVSESVAATV